MSTAPEQLLCVAWQVVVHGSNSHATGSLLMVLDGASTVGVVEDVVMHCQTGPPKQDYFLDPRARYSVSPPAH